MRGYRLPSGLDFQCKRALSQLACLARSAIHIHPERPAAEAGVAGALDHLADELLWHIEQGVLREKRNTAEAAIG